MYNQNDNNKPPSPQKIQISKQIYINLSQNSVTNLSQNSVMCNDSSKFGEK